MNKKGWSICVGVLIFIFAIFIFFWNGMPTWVSHSLSEKAGVNVSISHFTLSPWSVGAHQIKMKNPKQSLLPDALKIQTLQVDAPLTRFFKNDIVIDSLILNDVYLGLEFEAAGKTKGNWSVIMDNIRRSNNEDAKKSGESDSSVLIKKLTIYNTNVDLVFRQGNQQVKHLKPIKVMTFENISSEGGIPSNQITNLVMSQMLKEVFSLNNLMNMLQDVLPNPASSLKSLSPLKSLFSHNENELETIQE